MATGSSIVHSVVDASCSGPGSFHDYAGINRYWYPCQINIMYKQGQYIGRENKYNVHPQSSYRDFVKCLCRPPRIQSPSQGDYECQKCGLVPCCSTSATLRSEAPVFDLIRTAVFHCRCVISCRKRRYAARHPAPGSVRCESWT